MVPCWSMSDMKLYAHTDLPHCYMIEYFHGHKYAPSVNDKAGWWIGPCNFNCRIQSSVIYCYVTFFSQF